MNIYIVRHGETDWNVQLKLQGRSDIPLNATGIEQAEQTGENLKKAGISFDKVYSSPLQRAVKTAELISGFRFFKYHKRKPHNRIFIWKSRRLNAGRTAVKTGICSNKKLFYKSAGLFTGQRRRNLR